MFDSADLRARLTDVRARVARAAGRVGRNPSSVRLVAISKTFPVELVRAAAEAGQIDFGENKVQDALEKMNQTSDLPLRWHLVGHLQSNKIRKAFRFDVVHSIDEAATVGRLDDAAREAGRRVDLIVQVDLAGESTKHGARESEVAGIFRAARSATAVRMIGLMLLPPAVAEPDAARPYFRELRAVRDRLTAGGVDPGMLTELSMGMSHDFEVAIEEGATLVRVGTAIFGDRPPPKPGSDGGRAGVSPPV